jgi:quinol monooxygenase YgiN
MIIRVFRAKIRKGRVQEFKRMVKEQSIPWLQKSGGMLGYFPGEPFGENKREFLMVTLWQDQDSLEAFAGKDWDDPVVTADEAPLVEAMYADHYFRFDKDEA